MCYSNILVILKRENTIKIQDLRFDCILILVSIDCLDSMGAGQMRGSPVTDKMKSKNSRERERKNARESER